MDGFSKTETHDINATSNLEMFNEIRIYDINAYQLLRMNVKPQGNG